MHTWSEPRCCAGPAEGSGWAGVTWRSSLQGQHGRHELHNKQPQGLTSPGKRAATTGQSSVHVKGTLEQQQQDEDKITMRHQHTFLLLGLYVLYSTVLYKQ
jgi:hypothetical protein